LFETLFGLAVKTKQIGKPPLKNILCRSLEMDALILAEWRAIIQRSEHKAGFSHDRKFEGQ